MLKAARWNDNDRYLGPLTWSYSSSYPHWAIILRSQGEADEEDGRGCTLRVSLWKMTLILALPNVVRSYREKVYPGWDERTIARLGRDWYWNVDPRQYGFSLNEGHLAVYYGRTGGASMDSSTQQQWSCFLPWTQWRYVRHSLYDLDGNHVWTEPRGSKFEAYRAAKDACPKVKFLIEDYDGERITATTMIEEREWRFGEGWFKWLSLFRRRKIRRSLDIEFSSETGPEKGSWKGGTTGCGIDVRPGELHEDAFRRYCSEQHRSKYQKYAVKFLSRID